MQKLIPNRIRQPLKRRVNNFRQRRFGSKEARVYTGNWGIRYLVYPDSWLDYEVVRHGAYACWLVAHGAEFLDKAATVFDIGANAGLVAVPLAAHIVPKGRVYAFEPDDACHAHLLTNMRLNNLVNVEPRRMALQDSPATESISFYRRRLTMASGLVNDGLSSIQPIDDGSGTVSRVVASTVDKEAASEVLQRLDAIKIDVEGAEHRVLLGARNTVLRFGPVIEYEYSTKHDAMTETTNSRDTFNLLQELGYTQYLIRHDDRLILWHKPDAALPIGNLICVPFCASDALRNTIQKLLA